MRPRAAAEPAAWTVDEFRHKCATHMLNAGWQGYRLGDMTGSRFWRHMPGSGIMWHARTWPHSLVAKYENEYNHKRNRRYTVLTNGTCLTSKCESRGEGPCPCYIPGVPALLDMMREAGAAPVAREAAVHVRAGEVIDLSPHAVDKMLSEPTKFGLKCPHTAWTDAPCLNINPFHYVQTLGFFDSVRSELCRLGLSRVVLVAGSNFNLTTGFNKSCDYLERVGTFFARSGVDVGFRIGRSPDADFKYFTTRVAAFVPTGGRYSELAAEVGAKLGVAVLRVNQSDALRRPRYVNTC